MGLEPVMDAHLCECDCGGITTIATRTNAARGHVRGLPVRFLKGHYRDRAIPWERRYIVEDHGYSTPCWIWQGGRSCAGEYGSVEYKGRKLPAHKVALLRIGVEIPVGWQVDHLCGVTLCINPDHLEPVTHTENVRRSSATKLTLEDVIAIRQAFGITQVELAHRYGVTRSAISHVLAGRSWQ